MRFADFKVGIKLSIAFAMLLIVTLTLGCLSLWQIQRMDQAMEAIGEDALPSVALAGNIRAHWNRMRRYESLMLLDNTSGINLEYQDKIEDIHASIKASEALFLQLNLSPQEQEWLTVYRKYRDNYLTVQKRFLLNATDTNVDPRVTLRIYEEEAEPHFAGLAETVGKISTISQDDAKVLRQQAYAVKDDALLWILMSMAISCMLSVLFAWRVTRAIATPAQQALQVAHRIAAGDLAQPVHSQSHDEMGQLMQALERMRTQLLQVVQDVRRNAESVAVASEEIATGSSQLSARTEEQAAALEQTAASMEELSTTVQLNAGNAQEANAMAHNAAQIAEQGGTAVAKVVETMRSIRDASTEITDIVGVIEAIAFQTNILALNAAVEAARAGEQGRGFAVVASEVRVLAGRCAEAAKEIQQVVSRSGARILVGSDMADQAGATMQEVVQAIHRVNTLVASISASSAEQSAGVAQIGQVIMDLDSTTQKNAALVEENAAASDSLNMQAQALVRAVAVFQTGAQQHALVGARAG